MKFDILPQEWIKECPYPIDDVDYTEDKTLFIEVCTQHTKSKKYKDAFIQGDWSEWSLERIKRAFNFNNGTIKDFEEYMKANKCLGVKAFRV